jgi:UDP-N-acetylmuramate: L-alanyl-gamma-D-glutamyl-meso-diaminopimelate ligase
MLAWMLSAAGHDPGYLIGGLPKNLGRGARFTESAFNVLEGDEYDTAFFDKRSKFLHYLPECVIINNIEFDHADIYNSLDEILLSFRRLLNIVPRSGVAFINGDDPDCLNAASTAPCPVKTVGFGEACDIRIEITGATPGNTGFRLDDAGFNVPMDGAFNVRNAAMAVSAARFAGVPDDAIRSALAEFSGVARRQEVRGESNGIKVIDDFAHHPTAIREALASMRSSNSGARLWAIFEPRSNTTRRAIFQNALADALSLADFAVIAAIPDLHKIPENDRLDPARLAADIGRHGTRAWHLETIDAIVHNVATNARPGDVVAVLSNGGFGGIHQRLLDALAPSQQTVG